MGSFVSCEKVEFLCKFIGLFIVLCPASFGTHTLRLGSALQLSKCTCAVLLWMSVNLSIDLLSFVKKTKEKLFTRFFNLIISKISQFFERVQIYFFLSVSLLTQQYDRALFSNWFNKMYACQIYKHFRLSLFHKNKQKKVPISMVEKFSTS